MDSVFKILKDTYEGRIALRVKEIYDSLEKQQLEWYSRSGFVCPSGCGCCCHDFEPDLNESEVCYLALWLLENKTDVAHRLADGSFYTGGGKTCIFFSEENEYHCTVYGGRPFICRLFGASCTWNKNHEIVWRPCKFYPDSRLSESGLDRKDYKKSEAETFFGVIPPVMSDVMLQDLGLIPDNEKTFPLRDILPDKIRHVCSILKYCGNS